MKVLSSLKSAKTVLAAKLFAATVSFMSFRKPTLALKRVKVGKRKVNPNKKRAVKFPLFFHLGIKVCK